MARRHLRAPGLEVLLRDRRGTTQASFFATPSMRQKLSAKRAAPISVGKATTTSIQSQEGASGISSSVITPLVP
jgi:hypothetical protein